MREKWKSEKHSTSQQNKERRKTVRVKLVIQYREEQWMGFHANCQLVTTIKQTDGYLSYQLSHSSALCLLHSLPTRSQVLSRFNWRIILTLYISISLKTDKHSLSDLVGTALALFSHLPYSSIVLGASNLSALELLVSCSVLHLLLFTNIWLAFSLLCRVHHQTVPLFCLIALIGPGFGLG